MTCQEPRQPTVAPIYPFRQLCFHRPSRITRRTNSTGESHFNLQSLPHRLMIFASLPRVLIMAGVGVGLAFGPLSVHTRFSQSLELALTVISLNPFASSIQLCSDILTCSSTIVILLVPIPWRNYRPCSMHYYSERRSNILPHQSCV